MLYFLKFALIAYLILLGALYLQQRHLLYMPAREKPQALPGMEWFSVTTEDGLTLEGGYFPPKNPQNITLLYFHGNGGNFAHRYVKIVPYLEAGYGVLLAEYRGYGGNPGHPTEQGLYADARAYLAALRAKTPQGQIVLYGESLGSGVAVQLASETIGAPDIAGMVLETAFTSITDIAAKHYFYIPVRLLLKDRYESADKIPSLKIPLLFLHGDRDTVVPYDNGRSLYAAATAPKTFVTIAGGAHNNLHDFAIGKSVLDFLYSVSAARTPTAPTHTP